MKYVKLLIKIDINKIKIGKNKFFIKIKKS